MLDKNGYPLTLLRNDVTLTGVRDTVASAHRHVSAIHRAFGYSRSACLLQQKEKKKKEEFNRFNTHRYK